MILGHCNGMQKLSFGMYFGTNIPIWYISGMTKNVVETPFFSHTVMFLGHCVYSIHKANLC